MDPGPSDTRTRILDAAEAICRAGGLGSLSMRAIAERIGLSAPAAYRHFKGKREILEAMIFRGYGNFLEGLAKARRGLADPSDELAATVRYYLRFWSRDRRGFLLALEWERDKTSLTGGAISKGSFGDLPELTARILGEGRDRTEAAQLARWTAATLYGMTLSLVQDEELPPARANALIDSAAAYLVGAVQAAAGRPAVGRTATS